MTTTDTPRTDAEILRIWKGKIAAYVSIDFAKQLERELYQSNLKVDRIRAEKNACIDGNEYYGDKVAILQDKINRAIDVLMEKIV